MPAIRRYGLETLDFKEANEQFAYAVGKLANT